MKTTKNKTMTILITLILMITIAIPLVFLPPNNSVEAQLAPVQPTVNIPAGSVPNATFSTISHLSYRPNPVGIGQPLLINMWMQFETFDRHRKYHDAFQLTITAPDGKIDVFIMDSYPADATMWKEIVPDKVGNYTLKFDFLGNFFPAGRYLEGNIITATSGGTNFAQSEYHKPSSDGPYILVVQEAPVASYPSSAMPTEYWTRPVHPQNREWWSLLGNYPPTGVYGGEDANWPADTNPYTLAQYGYVPYVSAPTSSHIVWKRQFAIGGIVGGSLGPQSLLHNPGLSGANAGDSVDGHPTMIYGGRGYYSVIKPFNGITQNVWQCYDIRTGELFWEKTDVPFSQRPTFIMYAPPAGPVEGSQPYEVRPLLGYIGGGQLIKYNPMNGEMIGNYSIAPLTTGTFYKDPCALSIQDLGASAGTNRYRLINWTTLGTSANLTTSTTTRVISNITWAWNSLPTTVDFEAEIAVRAENTRIRTYSLNTGNLLADVNTTIGYGTFAGPSLTDQGKFARRYNDGYWHCWDIRTGEYLWKSELSSWPWATFGTYGSTSYGGLILSNQYDAVAAINWTNGKVEWVYTQPTSPYESPYTGPDGETVQPWHACSIIADGIYFTMNSEHSPSQPLRRDWKMHAINITTGEGIWKIASAQSGLGTGSRVFQGAIADGYLLYSDAYTGYMYAVGKGKSETTVTAPQTNLELGQSFTITGTVLDISPAQSGTPAISDKDMDLWMEYQHMQMPKPKDATGVTVELSAFDPNGNSIDIGKATSDSNGVFGFTWTPQVPGLYQIVATFAGSNSYGSSTASTYLTAVEGPVTPSPSPQPLASTADLYFVPAIAGLFVLVIVVAIVLALLMLRKHP
jgi:hypothetical protein